MTNGFTCIPHSIWELPIEMEERYMLLYLLDCENRYSKFGEWFSVSNKEFINIGFGSCKSRWKKYRDDLIGRKWISYKEGGPGRKSQYRINHKKDDNNAKQE